MMRWCSLLLFFLATLPVTAVVVLQKDANIIIAQDQVINDDLVVSGGNVQILGHITGDLVVAGGVVTVNGPIDGDIIAVGHVVNLYGPVGGSVYAAGNIFNLNSTVGRNVVAAGDIMSVEQGTRIARDLAVAGINVTFAGMVGRDLLARSGVILLTNTARVQRNLQAMTSHPNIAAGAVIGGMRSITPPQRHHRGREVGWHLLRAFLFVISLFLVGLLFLAIAPKLTVQTEDMLQGHPWGSLLVGFLVLLLAPLALLLIAVTCLGLPLAVMLSWLYLSALFIAPIFTAILAGRWIQRKPDGNLYLALLFGLLVLMVVLWIPVLNFLAMLIILVLGLGALTLALQARTAHPLFAVTPPPATPEEE